MNNKNPKCIAFYLPQYHPIPENDEWWGKGFTEWTNAVKAKPLFPGHYQPHLPSDLGFYDLRLEESRVAQAELAKTYGISGFCYYHYWFAGRQILNQPFDAVLSTKKPDLPFCLCWANESWSGVWHGSPKRILIEQTYPGLQDAENHFNYLLVAFKDERYIRIGDRPLFLIYKPENIPNGKELLSMWRGMAISSGLKDVFFVGVSSDDRWNPNDHGYDGVVLQKISPRVKFKKPKDVIQLASLLFGKILKLPTIYNYKDAVKHLLPNELIGENRYPCVIPNWDNTARSGSRGLVLHNSSPEYFRMHLKAALKLKINTNGEHRLIFIKSWNEWAEGNHLEPDLKFGKKYLEVLKEEILAFAKIVNK